MKKDKILTVEEFINSKINRKDLVLGCLDLETVSDLMIDFTKLHIEACKKEISEKTNYPYRDEFGSICNVSYIVENAYPLSNIK